MRKSIAAIILLCLASIGYYTWSERKARIEAEQKLGLDATRVVSEHFTNAAALKVATLRGEVVTRAEDKGLGGMLPTEQTTKTPYTVDYFVELSRLGPAAYRWDAARRTVTIDVPDVTVARPNLDEAKARIEQKGVFISRRAARELARKSSQLADSASKNAAKQAKHLDKARANARAEIGRLSAGPLQTSGLGDVQVAVSFPWEPKAFSGSSKPWDVSRPVEDVMRDRARARTTPATTPSS